MRRSSGWAWPRVDALALRWSVGALCAVNGVLMLVVPHQFASPVYVALVPHLPWWGAFFLAAGTALLGVAVLSPRRPYAVATHLFAAGALLLMARGFASIGGWTGSAFYGVLGLSTALAGAAPAGPRGIAARRDLFTVTMGTAAALIGLTMLVAPGQFAAAVFATIRPYLVWYGLAFFCGGLALWAVQLRRGVPPVLSWAAYLFVALTFFAFAARSALPLRAWTGIALYAGFGAMLAAFPWLGPRLHRVDVTSLRARLALALCAAAALPLVVAVSWYAQQVEDAATGRVLALHQTVAEDTAQDVAQDVAATELAATSVVSAVPGLLAMAPEAQTALLKSLKVSPEVLGFATFDANGKALARSDGRPPADVTGDPLVERVRLMNAPTADFVMSPSVGRPILRVAAPVPGAPKPFAGLLMIESGQIAGHVAGANAGAGGRAYLLDADGRAIARSGPSPAVSFIPRWEPTPVARLGGSAPSGTLVYQAGGSQWLAGYAGIPSAGWTLVVEQPSDVALADVRAGREVAFGVLAAAEALAAVAGVVVAGRLARPLNALSAAVAELADGRGGAPLPRSSIGEVATLADAFAALRDRLAARTAERERAEAALRESEERARMIVETALDCVVTMDGEGRITGWNRQAEATFGWPRDEVLGRRLAETIIPPEHREAHERGLRRFLATGQGPILNRRIEVTALRRDGHEIPAELAVTAVPAGGQPLFNAFVRDVTAQKRSEQERALLLEAEQAARAEAEQAHQRAALLAEASAALAASLDYETTLRQVTRLAVPRLADWCSVDMLEDDGRIVRVAVAHADPAKEPLLHELASRYPADLDQPRRPAIVLRTGRSFLTTDIADEDLHTTARDEQHLRILRDLAPRSVLNVPLIARGRRLGVLSFTYGGSGRRYTDADLTWAADLAGRAAIAIDNARLYREAREAEDGLRTLNATLEQRIAERTEQLEAAIRELEAFSYSVSHDLRAPLRSINGFSRILLETYAPQLPPEACRYLGLVGDGAQRMGRLIDDLLSFSRTSRQPLAKQEVDPALLVQQVVAELRADAGERRVEIDVGALPRCEADPALVRQVFANLLSNALKFTAGSEVARIAVGSLRDGDAWVYFVRDNGVGFDMRYADKLFGVFQRLHRREEYEGTGVGLALVQRIVHRHGGRIWAESAVGRGATFYFTLGGDTCP